MSVKATADDTDRQFRLLEASEPPNFGPPMHIHRDADDAHLSEVAERYGMEVLGPVPEGYI